MGESKANPPKSPFHKGGLRVTPPLTKGGLGGISFYAAITWLILVLFCAVTVGLWPLPFALDQIDAEQLAALPGGAHLLGTDATGRDIAARLLFGARVSLTVGICAPLLGLGVGLLLGMPSGLYRGWTERVIMTCADVILAFPGLIFLLVFTALLGPSLTTITLGLGLLISPRFVRVVRANTIRFAEREFVQAARIGGAGDISILLREILPNILGPLMAYTLVVAGFVIVAEGGLGFLGLSVPSPTPSWGGMIAAGRDALEQTPHVAMIPTGVMFLTVLSINVIGDRLRGRYDRG
ncbi:MAG: ABC transporter permease [Deltaproteobacteria bacterium]|nr:ABC transporter permease [Deltaproteobacteria bacterium]